MAHTDARYIYSGAMQRTNLQELAHFYVWIESFRKVCSLYNIPFGKVR